MTIETKDNLAELERRFVEAANALGRFRDSHGFEPGVRVEARYQDEPVRSGVIAPFGEAWSTVDHTSVPVILENGRTQPWPMSYLTIIPEVAPCRT